MFKLKLLMGPILLTFGMSLPAGSIESQSEEALVSPADFTVIAGDNWKGTLSYLDYSSDTQQSIPVEIQFEAPKKRKVVYHIKYPGETQYNAKEELSWSRDGRQLNGETIISREQETDGTIILVTQSEGEDNNKPADIRMTYSLNKSALTIRTDVRLEGTESYFRRNAYELVR